MQFKLMVVEIPFPNSSDETKVLVFESKLPKILAQENLSALAQQTGIPRMTWHRHRQDTPWQINGRVICAAMLALNLSFAELFDIYEKIEGQRVRERLGDVTLAEIKPPLKIVSRLGDWLKEKSLSQAELSRQSGVERRVIGQYVRNSFETLHLVSVGKLMLALNCNFGELFEFEAAK